MAAPQGAAARAAVNACRVIKRSGERVINQNVGRGVLVGAVALLFLVQAPRYTIGSLSRPGPGLFPVLVAGILLTIAVIMIARSYFLEAQPFEFHFRNIALIAGALLSFALVSHFVNMIAGIAVMATIASYASEDFSIPRTAVIVVGLCLIAVAMKKLLGVQLPLY
jgi:hypothetical protein